MGIGAESESEDADDKHRYADFDNLKEKGNNIESDYEFDLNLFWLGVKIMIYQLEVSQPEAFKFLKIWSRLGVFDRQWVNATRNCAWNASSRHREVGEGPGQCHQDLMHAVAVVVKLTALAGCQRRADWQAGNFTASGALENLSVFAQILHWN